MTEVAWERVPSGQYEDMVAVLLSHMNPGIRRIDGAGGDGGRDAEFPREAGPEIYQLKSFTGRMTASRRRQVERSLKKAAARNPVEWHLVVPIDPTPGEEDWFEHLRGTVHFPISWKGRTWLNTRMAERPFIPRYFLEGESERVIEILTQMQQEKAAIADIQTGVDRIRALADRINELDPYYRFDVAVRNGSVEIGMVPRYEGAERDRPVRVTMALAFPDTDDGRAAAAEFQAAMDFGAPVDIQGEYIQAVEIDAPAGFAGTFPSGGYIKLGPPNPAQDWHLDAILGVLTQEGVRVASLPIYLTDRTTGRRGLVVRGADRARAISVEIRLEIETRRANLNFRFSATSDHYPHELLPALGFMRATAPPNRIQLLVGEQNVPMSDPIEVPNVLFIEDGYVKLVEDLARVQRESRTFFPMPPEFSKADLRELAEAIDLLDGKEVEQSWSDASFELIPSDPKGLLDELASKAEGATFVTEREAGAAIAGHILPLGTMRTYIPAARIANLDELRKAVERSSNDEGELSMHVALEAIGDKILKRSLLPR